MAPLSLWLSLLLGIIGIAGPAIDQVQVPVFQADKGAVVLFDASIQTRAQDIAPDRHTRMRFKAVDLVNRFGDGQLGLIAYAGDAFTVTPLTRDSRNILQSLTVLEPELMPSPGHDPLLGFEEADRLLSAAGYREGDIYWFTGGISNRDMDDVRRFLRNKAWRVHVLAVGTQDGAPVRGRDGELIRDERGRVILPRLEPAYLQQITRMTGGQYVAYQQDNTDIEQLLAASETDQQAFIETMEQGDQWRDLGPFVVLFILPFALFAARRGVLYCLPILMISSLLLPQAAYATEQAEPSTNIAPRARLSLLEQSLLNADQQGARLQQMGDYEQAAERFHSLAHQAQAHYRAGNFSRAAELYAQLEGAEYKYNLGNALAQLGDLEGALTAYQDALTKQPDWQEARENYELVKSLRDQQDAHGDDDGDSESSDERDDNDEPQQGDQDNQDMRPEDSADPDADNDTEDSSSQDEQGNDETSQDEPDTTETDTDTDAGMEKQEESASLFDDDTLTDEERAELEQLLRRVEEDPALILRNRLQREAQRRQMQRPPRGF
ncbi:tetratricopeptide repeat protein [Aliidiomarina halalkaliphila]|nr:tetratricopeptide repeat protein [Aliidiomarina halalkaliphila]